MKLYKLIQTLLFLLPLAVSAQTVTNVIAEQVGKNIVISYQLDKQADISIQYSTDGGNTYRSMSHTTGDIGRGIQAGERTIIWDVLSDFDKLVCNNLVFKVAPSNGDDLTFTINGVQFTMIRVEGGTFTMGATAEQGDDVFYWENPAHSVTLSTYYMGETEVTQALWFAVTGKLFRTYNERNTIIDDECPVYSINWDDCNKFIKKLNDMLSSQLGGMRFAIPTEAQWEYAARGGNKSQGYKYSGSNNLSEVACYDGNASRTTPLSLVKTKLPNELGLYDMSGNVCEWCQDCFGLYSSGAQTNPRGNASGSSRITRGGSCYSNRADCRVSSRDYAKSSSRYVSLGLRICLLP